MQRMSKKHQTCPKNIIKQDKRAPTTAQAT